MARVGIDLDGVCYDFAGALRAYLNCLPEMKARTFPNPTCWEFYRVDWGFTTGEFIDLCHAGVDAGVIFTHGDPTEDAANQLRRLRAAGHTIHIITDRSFGSLDREASRNATRAWLRRHQIEYDTLTFSSDKTSIPTDVMIDDKIENHDALRGAGCDAWLLRRPWNRVPLDNRWRVRSLEEFVDYVLEEYPMTLTTDGVRTTSSTGGEKGVKPQRFDLIPVHPLTVLAEHYGKGAEKYSDHQWMKGYEWSKSYQALLRHLTQWWGGEDLDPETGSNHVAAVAWHSFALLQFIRDHPQFDDRPKVYDAEPAGYPDIVDGEGDAWRFECLGARGVALYVPKIGGDGSMPWSADRIYRRYGAPHPDEIVDGEGDMWVHVGDGEYTWRRRGGSLSDAADLAAQTPESIYERFGKAAA